MIKKLERKVDHHHIMTWRKSNTWEDFGEKWKTAKQNEVHIANQRQIMFIFMNCRGYR